MEPWAPAPAGVTCNRGIIAMAEGWSEGPADIPPVYYGLSPDPSRFKNRAAVLIDDADPGLSDRPIVICCSVFTLGLMFESALNAIAARWACDASSGLAAAGQRIERRRHQGFSHRIGSLAPKRCVSACAPARLTQVPALPVRSVASTGQQSGIILLQVQALKFDRAFWSGCPFHAN